jgi:hemerythrin-like metal-binding protein
MSVGVSSIDDHHREWISRVNYLSDSIKDGRANEGLKVALQETMSYTLVHFMAEERLMKIINYPQLDIHAQEHTMFAQRMRGYIEAYVKGTPVLAIDVVQFIKTWVLNHLQTTDQGDAEFIRANRKEKADRDRTTERW